MQDTSFSQSYSLKEVQKLSIMEPYEIRSKIIEEFEKQITEKDFRGVEIFLKRLVQEKPYSVYFNPPGLCLRLLKLLMVTTLNSRQQDCILSFFRRKNGLPEGLLENDLVLQGIENSIPCSTRLLGIVFKCFKNISSCNFCCDDVGIFKAKVIKLPLGKESLGCLKEYILSDKIMINSEDVLQELLQFSCNIEEAPLQNKVLFAIAKIASNYIYQLRKAPSFNIELIRDKREEFSMRFLIETKADFKILDNGRYSISYESFIKLFRQKEYSEILHLVVEEIDEVVINKENFDILKLGQVPKQYRAAIISIVYKGEIFIDRLYFIMSLFHNHNFRELVKKNTILLKKDANIGRTAMMYAVLGEKSYLNENFPEAKEHIINAITLKPTEPFFYQLLGGVLRKMELYDDAEAALRTAIKLYEQNYTSPGNKYFAYEMLGFILSVKNDCGEARALLERAVELNPKRI